MRHEPTIARSDPMDAAAPVYWTCSCGAAGDEDWASASGALAHYHATHASGPVPGGPPMREGNNPRTGIAWNE